MSLYYFLSLGFVALLHFTQANANDSERLLKIVYPGDSPTRVAMGTTLTISCEGEAPNGIRWLHNGMPISSDVMSRATVRPGEGTTKGDNKSTLAIDQVKHSDAGNYRCEEENEILNTANIEVDVFDSNDVQILEVDGNLMKVHINDSVNLKCSAPLRAEIEWRHGDELLKDGVGGRVITESEDNDSKTKESHLLVEDIQEEDLGTYWCINPSDNEHSDFVTLTLTDEDGLQRICMKTNSQITLTCEVPADSISNSRFIWRKAHQKLENNKKYKVAIDQLTIYQTNLDDTGIYLCEVVSVANNQIKASLAFDVTAETKPGKGCGLTAGSASSQSNGSSTVWSSLAIIVLLSSLVLFTF